MPRGRKSPLGIEGTGLSFRDPDDKGRMTSAMARAKDEAGRWQVRRFPVTSWRRDGSPVVPEEAVDWAREQRKDFVKGVAVAGAARFQDFADLLADHLAAAGIGAERVGLVRSIARALEGEGITDMRADSFPVRCRAWLTGLKSGWSMAEDAFNRRTNPVPLSAATRNKLLVVMRQVTGLAVRRRRLPFDPLEELPRFKEERTIKATFTIAELATMVSDGARDHAAAQRAEIEAEIASRGGPRTQAIKAMAIARGCHWSSIYNALARDPGPDPWWLACCLLVYTGARADEAMNLRWEWIKWDARVIHLKLAEDYASKSDTERLIPLEPELAAILHPIARPAGHILPPEIRAGGSGQRKRSTDGEGARDYTCALRLYLARIGVDAKDRTAHSLRHTYISIKLARADMNTERLRKAVGHKDFSTTQGYASTSQLYEAEVDTWPDSSLWLRRATASINDKNSVRAIK